MAAMPPTPLPLGGGITFQCNGTQVSLAPPICSTQVLKAKYTAKAVPVGFKVFDTAEPHEARLTPRLRRARAAGGERWISI